MHSLLFLYSRKIFKELLACTRETTFLTWSSTYRIVSYRLSWDLRLKSKNLADKTYSHNKHIVHMNNLLKCTTHCKKYISKRTCCIYSTLIILQQSLSNFFHPQPAHSMALFTSMRLAFCFVSSETKRIYFGFKVNY